jgi:hypothetical protein
MGAEVSSQGPEGKLVKFGSRWDDMKLTVLDFDNPYGATLSGEYPFGMMITATHLRHNEAYDFDPSLSSTLSRKFDIGSKEDRSAPLYCLRDSKHRPLCTKYDLPTAPMTSRRRHRADESEPYRQ